MCELQGEKSPRMTHPSTAKTTGQKEKAQEHSPRQSLVFKPVLALKTISVRFSTSDFDSDI